MTSIRCNTNCHKSVGFIIFVIIAIASGDNSVRLLLSDKEEQYITSSTLNWIPVNHYDDTRTIVVGGFQRNEDSNDPSPMKNDRQKFVCRVSHQAAFVAGTQLEGEKRCTVTLEGRVKSYDRYELLENVENAARLSWLPWDKYQGIPSGAIYVDRMFVARYVTNEIRENGTSYNVQYIGTLENISNLGTIFYVNDDGTEGTSTKGEVLVETEPTYYELKSISLNLSRQRVIKNESRIIGDATISNSRNTPADFGKAIGYSYKYINYWGQGHAMIMALNTSITLSNGTRLQNIAWGMEDEIPNVSDAYTVEIHLQPGTGVNVTLKANYIEFDVHYTGELVSHYDDGETKARVINGIRREAKIMNIEPNFSPIYFLGNLTIVPTTLAPPTTHGTTGTTSGSTTKSTTISSSSTNNIASTATATSDITNNEDDENMIVPPRKPSMSNIQNDDSGPLSLKNKENMNDNSSNIIELSVTIFLASLFINLYRIT